jgi:branched-chain amino acid aminotransferase
MPAFDNPGERPCTPAALPEELGFGRYFTERMFVQRYDVQRGWHDGAIVPYGPLSIDPAAQLFHCGQAIFEGMKALRRPDGGVNLFRVDEHASRFNRSAQRMAMPAVDPQLHMQAIRELVRQERAWIPERPGASLYVRPVMFASERSLEVRASRSYVHYIILSPISAYFGSSFRPVSVFVSDEHFRAVRGGTGEAKTVANYAMSLYATELARANGYDQVLWLDAVERRYVEEVGAMSLAFVYGGKYVRTPALSGSILPSVTRDSVLKLAPDLGFPVYEERIDAVELLRDVERGEVSEVFCMGTAAVVAPIVRIGFRGRDYEVGGAHTGAVAKRLYEGLTDIQYGRANDPYGWTTLLDASAPAQVTTAV